ncbi:MAG: N-formylglutamate amidohydrolase [Alphaproteobacteria bacterium]
MPREPVELRRPYEQAVPIVLASPHSGRNYPEAFVRQSRLDALALRRSEDFLIDEIFGAGPSLGMPLVAARFPRAFCDANREPYELDPQMFEERLPAFVNTRSVRVACGLGTIARVVSDGAEIYSRRLSFAEAEARLSQCYRPYHAALKEVMAETGARYGQVLLLDCHSMPSIGGPLDLDAGLGRKDVVVGDRYGTSCDQRTVRLVEALLREQGFDVARNSPYAGGYTTQLYGRPAQGLHAIQIELNRALYMDEREIEPGPGFGDVVRAIQAFLGNLAESMASESASLSQSGSPVPH